jgi:hypothetical protein
MSPWILRHRGMEWLMLDILVELLMCHCLNHELNVWNKSTRSSMVCGSVSYLIHNVLKNIKPCGLHDRIQQVPLIGRHSFRIFNPWR